MPVKDNVIMAYMKAMVNQQTPLTDAESGEFLDTIFKMLKQRRAHKRMAEIRRIMRRGV